MAEEDRMTDLLGRVLEKMEAQGEQIQLIVNELTDIKVNLAKRETQGAQIDSIRRKVEDHDRMITQHRTIGQVLIWLGGISSAAALTALFQVLTS